MPEAYYIIPMTSPPYSRENPQRPMYVDEIRCNWTGHNVNDLNIYICKVNTTEAKHIDLAGRTGVRQMPRNYTWDTVISTMPPATRNFISNWCNSKDVPFDSSETIGQLLIRIINIGLFHLGSTALNTQYQNLTQDQRDKISALCTRFEVLQPGASETLRQISDRLGPSCWSGNELFVEEY